MDILYTVGSALLLVLAHLQELWYLYVIGGLICGFLSWLHATYIKVREGVALVKDLQLQFKPNGGQSIKDSLNRIEHELRHIKFVSFAQLDIIDTPVFVSNNNGKYVWVNKAYLALTKMSFEEALGSGWEMTIAVDDRQRMKEEWYTACQESRPFHSSYTMKIGNSTIEVSCDAIIEPNVGYFGSVKREV